MDRWTKFGKAIGSHMSFIAPTCVILGVLFPEVFGLAKPAVPAMFALLTFQGSLNNDFKSVAVQFRHPKDVLCILGVSMIAMPVVAHLIASLLFSGNPNLVTGVTLEYCVPVGVVCFMWCGMYEGDLSLALASILVSTVLSPVSIPFTLKLLLGADVQVDVPQMMSNMAFMIALPAIAGMLVNNVTYGWGHKKLSPALSPAVKVLLMIIIASNSSQMSDQVRHLTPELVEVAAFILVFAACGFALGIGLALVCKRPTSRIVTSCFCVGIRNISAGAVIAAQFFPGEVVFPVMMGTLFQQALAGIYGSLMERKLLKS